MKLFLCQFPCLKIAFVGVGASTFFERRQIWSEKNSKIMPRRSLWKGSFVDAFLAELKNKKDVLANKKIWSRRSSILPEFLNTTVRIYNGRNFVRCKVTEEKVGHKFGEFALTRKRRPFGAPKGKKWVIMPPAFTVGRLQNFSLAYLNGSYFMNNLVFGSCILFWTKLRCTQKLCFGIQNILFHEISSSVLYKI